jgi:hypothetical protein
MVRVGGRGGVLVEMSANCALPAQFGPDGVLAAYRGLKLVDSPAEWSSHLKAESPDQHGRSWPGWRAPM